MRQLRVFLCHASQDKPAVRELYNALNSEGWIDPWLDKAKILPGQDWEMVIEKAVDDSDVVLVCLSGQSISKEGYVQREIRYAYDLALEKPDETIFLIPLRLDDCNVPRKLKSLHWVDYFGEEKENAYSDLLKALKLRHEQKLVLEEKQTQEEVKKVTPPDSQLEKRFTQKKPFTKILDPATLNPPKPSPVPKKSDYRRYGLVGIFILLFIFGGLGLNSLFNKLPEATSTPRTQISTETFALPTETSVPFTPTLTETPAPSPTPTTVLGIGSTSRSLKDDMVLVYIPAGDFTMGTDDGREDTKPAHQVYLDAFWIDQTEVTNAMYKACVDQNKCNPPDKDNSATRLDYYGNDEYGNYPVIFVSWHDASSYCSWVGRRLPTEAEWEKAARGPNGNIYPWGNTDPKDTLLNYKGNKSDTTEVGSYPDGASLYGVLDLAGNVWEWVNDVYDPKYYQVFPANNPLGPESGDYRVLRGGSWSLQNAEVESTYRYSFVPEVTNGVFGFRCALSTR